MYLHFILNQFVEPILTLTSKDKMTSEMVLLCQQNVFSLLALESRHEPILLAVGHQPKGNKKDKLYRLLFAELATVLAAGPNTPEHKSVLHSVIAHCRLSSTVGDTPMPGVDKMEVDLAVREIDGEIQRGFSEHCNIFHLSTDPSKRTITLHKTQTDSPMSPPHSISVTESNSRNKNPFGASKGK